MVRLLKSRIGILKKKKILAGVGFGLALTLTVAATVAISVVSLGILAPVGSGLIASEVALLCSAFAGGITAIGSIGSGIWLVNMFYDQIRANYKKKLRLILYGNEDSHSCDPDDILEQKIVDEFAKCKEDLANYKPFLFSNPKEDILSKYFSGVSYTDKLWPYLETICIIKNLRELNSRVRIGGVVGAHNSGKSYFLYKTFGFNTSPGLSQEF